MYLVNNSPISFGSYISIDDAVEIIVFDERLWKTLGVRFCSSRIESSESCDGDETEAVICNWNIDDVIGSVANEIDSDKNDSVDASEVDSETAVDDDVVE